MLGVQPFYNRSNFVAKTLAQLNQQIESLRRQAEDIKNKEVPSVVGRIKEAIAAYGLTAADLGFGGRAGNVGAGKGKRAAKKLSGKKVAAKKTAGEIKFRDEAGNEWTGRGKRPGWYLAALAAGKTVDDLKVK
jgi:DNA-binding protein H-NS